MTKAVLFPTDFSDVSYKVFDVFDDLKAMGMDKVILLHVMDERGFRIMEAYGNLLEVEKQTLDQAQVELEEMAQKLREKGLDVDTKLEFGIPVRTILKAEKDEQVSMLALGSHGQSNLAEIFLGSVAEKVIRKSTKPVFLMKR